MRSASLDRLIELGAWDRALEDATAMTGPAEAAGDVFTLLQLRTAQVRILVGRGQAATARPAADWLAGAARESGGTEDIIVAFAAAAAALLATGEPDRAVDLLAQTAEWPHVREASLYPAYLAEMTRTATAAGDLGLAERLAAGLAPRFAYRQHALCAAAAVLAEGRGRLAAAADGYGEAAERWQGFGIVPERAHALLGRARCLAALGRPGAAEPAAEARRLFAGLGAAPLVAAADAVLDPAGA
jgi:hypothetical protein